MFAYALVTKAYGCAQACDKHNQTARQKLVFGVVVTPVRWQFCSLWNRLRACVCVQHECLCFSPVLWNSVHSSLWYFCMWSTIAVGVLYLPSLTVTCSRRSWSVDSYHGIHRAWSCNRKRSSSPSLCGNSSGCDSSEYDCSDWDCSDYPFGRYLIYVFDHLTLGILSQTRCDVQTIS